MVPVEGQPWDCDPFEVVERDGKYFGRGTTDMKGFDALAIWALVEAQRVGVSKPLQSIPIRSSLPLCSSPCRCCSCC